MRKNNDLKSGNSECNCQMCINEYLELNNHLQKAGADNKKAKNPAKQKIILFRKHKI